MGTTASSTKSNPKAPSGALMQPHSEPVPSPDKCRGSL